MRNNSHRLILGTALIALAATSIWAASFRRAAHSFAPPIAESRAADSRVDRLSTQGSGRERATRVALPSVVRFREVAGRGLLVRVWVNGAGSYTFAIDTGAGATLLSERVAREARVAAKSGQLTLGGLSASGAGSGREAQVRSLAVGEMDNLLPARGLFIITGGLPPDIDGVLDPTESYWPLGYTIDLPRGELSAFDPRATPLRRNDVSAGGAIVPWLFEAGSRRPFVLLNGTRRALLDTGSEFGLAVSRESARFVGIVDDGGGRSRAGVRDIGGGSVAARRIAPSTVNIGPLVLRGVPTDIMSGAHAGAPILLGREALAPFQLTFDPLNRLIRIEPR